MTLPQSRHALVPPPLPPDCRWKPLHVVDVRGERALWQCRCACGEERVVTRRDLASGRSRSCGCLRERRHRAAPPRMRPLPRPILQATPEQLLEFDLVVVAMREALGRRELTLAEIGLVLGLSRERVRQLQDMALAHLHDALQAEQLQAHRRRTGGGSGHG